MKIHKIVILCLTWSLTLREEHRLRVFENKVLEYLGLGRRKQQKAEENCIMGSFIICIFHQIFVE
jgi:hypothetical protein